MRSLHIVWVATWLLALSVVAGVGHQAWAQLNNGAGAAASEYWRQHEPELAPPPAPPSAAPPAAEQPPPQVSPAEREAIRAHLFQLRSACVAGDRRACVRYGIMIGENREQVAEWGRGHPELFFYER